MKECFCGRTLVPRAVPGAKLYPQRLECVDHGYQHFPPKKAKMESGDGNEKPNNYITEIASPADVILDTDYDAVDSRY